jgi:hypothetical protein
MLRARLVLLLAITAMAASGLTDFFVAVFGPFKYVMTIIHFSAPLLLLLSAWMYRRRLGPVVQRGAFGVKLFLLVLTIVFLSGLGLARGNNMEWVLRDTWAYVVILGGVLVGRFDRAFEDLEKPMVVLFWLLFAAAVAMLDTPRIISAGFFETTAAMTGTRASVESVGYVIADTLGFWPLVFLLGYLRPRMDHWKILSIGAALAWIGLQIYFQKRAPFARGMVYVAVAVAVIPMLQKRLKPGTAVLFILAMGVFLAVVESGASFQRLMQRYEEDPSFLQSSRVMEARSMLEDMHGPDWLVGKGMGGGYASPWKWSIRRLDERAEGMTLHIGSLMPLLKGGLLLMLVYYAFFVPLFTPKPPGWYASRLNVAAMGIVPVVLVFSLAEGGALAGGSLDALMVGLICGRGAVAAQPQYEYGPEVLLSDSELQAYLPPDQIVS